MLSYKWLTQFNPFVLEPVLFYIFITVDRNQTVSQRSEPSSRTALIGEQPNPWNPLQLQEAMNRHRGAKHSLR